MQNQTIDLKKVGTKVLINNIECTIIEFCQKKKKWKIDMGLGYTFVSDQDLPEPISSGK